MIAERTSSGPFRGGVGCGVFRGTRRAGSIFQEQENGGVKVRGACGRKLGATGYTSEILMASKALSIAQDIGNGSRAQAQAHACDAYLRERTTRLTCGAYGGVPFWLLSPRIAAYATGYFTKDPGRFGLHFTSVGLV